MRGRPSTRYVIRNSQGQELVCPSLADLHALYAQGFLADDDLVRAERSDRWMPAGTMPALRGARERRVSPRRIALVVAGGAALAVAMALVARALR